MAELVTILAATQMRGGINTTGKVSSVSEVRTVNLKAGGTKLVADAILKDSSGEIKLTLWGDDTGLVKQGDTINIENGYTNEYKGEISIAAGQYGKMLVNP
jgi:replication factor A1